MNLEVIEVNSQLQATAENFNTSSVRQLDCLMISRHLQTFDKDYLSDVRKNEN